MSSSYDNMYDELVKMSFKIKTLYYDLAKEEFDNGINSPEYKRILKSIRELEEIENVTLQKIYNDPYLLALYSSYMRLRVCERLDTKLRYEYDPCEKYVSLFSKDNIKETFQSDNIENVETQMAGRIIVMNSIFNLARSKKLIELLDYYKDDEEMKKFSIWEKYRNISCSSDLEHWYFNYGDPTRCLLSEDDSVNSANFRMPKEIYEFFRNRYYTNHFKIHTRNLLADDLKDDRMTKFFETTILSNLLCLDDQLVVDCYKYFFSLTEKQNYPKQNVDELEKLFSNYPVLVKKIQAKNNK